MPAATRGGRPNPYAVRMHDTLCALGSEPYLIQQYSSSLTKLPCSSLAGNQVQRERLRFSCERGSGQARKL